jgi:hypothetical protein
LALHEPTSFLRQTQKIAMPALNENTFMRFASLRLRRLAVHARIATQDASAKRDEKPARTVAQRRAKVAA